MRKEDFYTGEVLPSTSPPNGENFTSEQEAVMSAGFGQYDYNPAARLYQQPMQIGGIGYNPNATFSNFMNPPMGMYGGYNYYQNYNPNLYAQQQYYYQQQMMYQQQQQQQQVQSFIKPVNFSGEYLPPEGWEDKLEQLKIDYWMKEQQEAGESAVKNANTYNPFMGGYNYYGVPYYNSYNYNLNNELNEKLRAMEQEAKDNRLKLNLHLATLAHNYLGDDYEEETLKERYTGKYVDNSCTQITYGEMMQQQRFANMVPFDNSQAYREHHEAVSREFNSVIPKDSNLKDTFDNMGVLYAKYELEEEKQRRRDGTVLYNSEDGSYKYFVRRKAAERYAHNTGMSLVQAVENSTQNYQSNMISTFPTLSESAKLCDDGTLNITCNFGSHKGEVYSVHNSQEAGYEKDRERFNQFLDSIPQSIYLDSPTSSGIGG